MLLIIQPSLVLNKCISTRKGDSSYWIKYTSRKTTSPKFCSLTLATPKELPIPSEIYLKDLIAWALNLLNSDSGIGQNGLIYSAAAVKSAEPIYWDVSLDSFRTKSKFSKVSFCALALITRTKLKRNSMFLILGLSLFFLHIYVITRIRLSRFYSLKLEFVLKRLEKKQSGKTENKHEFFNKNI